MFSRKKENTLDKKRKKKTFSFLKNRDNMTFS